MPTERRAENAKRKNREELVLLPQSPSVATFPCSSQLLRKKQPTTNLAGRKKALGIKQQGKKYKIIVQIKELLHDLIIQFRSGQGSSHAALKRVCQTIVQIKEAFKRREP